MAALRFLTSVVAIVLFSPSIFAKVPSNACSGVSAEIATLTACSTASKFCSSYLRGRVTAISTVKTSTTITKDSPDPSQTVLSTTTVTSGTGESTAVATSTSYYVTTVVTTTALTCSPSQAPGKRGIDGETRNRKQTSCGFATSAIPSAISVACDCFLKPVTTITKTFTQPGPATGIATTSVTTQVVPQTYITTTSTSILMLGTSTIYSCVTPATPLCTPSPMSNFVANPSFENPPLPYGTTSKSSSNWNVNDPEPFENDFVTFISNSTYAPDGSIYMSMYSSESLKINAQQLLTGLPTNQYLTFNITYNIQMPVPDDPNDGNCQLVIVLGYNTVVVDATFYAPIPGWTSFIATAKPPGTDSSFLIQWYCPGYINMFSDPNGQTLSMYGTLNIDNIRVGVVNTHCPMNLEFYFPAIDFEYGYAALGSPDTTSSPNITLVQDRGLASIFSLDPYGNLFTISNGYPNGYWQQTNSEEINSGPIFASDLGTIFEYGDSLLNCALDPLTLFLTCSSFNGNNSFLNLVTDGAGNQILDLTNPNQSGGLNAATLKALYLS